MPRNATTCGVDTDQVGVVQNTDQAAQPAPVNCGDLVDHVRRLAASRPFACDDSIFSRNSGASVPSEVKRHTVTESVSR